MLLIDLINLFAEYSRKKYAKNSISSYFNNLKLFYTWNRDKDILDIEQKDIDNYIERLKLKSYKCATINGCLYTLKMFFRFCENKYHIVKNFNFHIKDFPKSSPSPHFISPVEFNKIIDNINYHQSTSEYSGIQNLLLRNLLIIQLLIETGVTTIELSKLKIKDIDFQKSSIKIEEKDRPDRILALRRGTLYLIQKYIDIFEIKEYLFFRLDRKSFSTEQQLVSRSIQRVVKFYSDCKFSPKDFRWTYILSQLSGDFGLQEICDMTGGMSDDTKTFWRKELYDLKLKYNITKNDYNAYEYLRHKHGKNNLLDKIYSGELRPKFGKELLEKYKI
jgi:site-specific recombinase XerD